MPVTLPVTDELASDLPLPSTACHAKPSWVCPRWWSQAGFELIGSGRFSAFHPLLFEMPSHSYQQPFQRVPHSYQSHLQLQRVPTRYLSLLGLPTVPEGWSSITSPVQPHVPSPILPSAMFPLQSCVQPLVHSCALSQIQHSIPTPLLFHVCSIMSGVPLPVQSSFQSHGQHSIKSDAQFSIIPPSPPPTVPSTLLGPPQFPSSQCLVQTCATCPLFCLVPSPIFYWVSLFVLIFLFVYTKSGSFIFILFCLGFFQPLFPHDLSPSSRPPHRQIIFMPQAFWSGILERSRPNLFRFGQTLSDFGYTCFLFILFPDTPYTVPCVFYVYHHHWFCLVLVQIYLTKTERQGCFLTLA